MKSSIALRKLIRALAVVAALASPVLCAGAGPIAPPPWQAPSGMLRVWGTPRAADIVGRWQGGFRGTRVVTHLTGSDIAMAALYTGQADIALIGREATDAEIKAFEWVFHYRPTRIEVATGSLASPGRSPALAVFVHRDNSLARIDFATIASVFGAKPAQGARSLRDWSDLGVSGEWSRHRIHLYAPDSESGSGAFFRARVLGGESKMNWENLDEFAEPARTPGVDVAGRDVLRALARDRYGMAIADLAYANAGVKALALRSDGEFQPPTRSTLIDGVYPLRRSLYAYINVPSHSAPGATVEKFLRHVLGAEGQHALEADQGGYLPLAKEAAQRQVHTLDELPK
ncbi:PstS family phosphate ABC transporter substrate-binding protein [Rudaea sp.]|uniref:PstS family phosphate ABC transporter substrate-binding protein n=1 Tax=Rudaea sp. TaxID=2136325 RepID=UPI002ED67BCB